MTALITGASIKATSGIVIDSSLPVTLTATKTLVPGIDQLVQADPSSGNIVLTLPDAASNAGVEFFVKRITNAGNIVSFEAAGADSIDGTANGYKLSLINEFIKVYSDGTTDWKISGKDIFSICSITSDQESFVVTTSPTKFTSWDTVVFGTPDKLVGNLTTNVVDVVEFQGPIADGYTVNVTFAFEYTNNNVVTVQLFINGVLTGIPVSENAQGNGKPVSISILQQVAVTSVTTLELHISAENAGTIDNIEAIMQIQRIGR